MRERAVLLFKGGHGGSALGKGVFQRRKGVGVVGMGVQIELEIIGEETPFIDGAEVFCVIHASVSFPRKGMNRAAKAVPRFKASAGESVPSHICQATRAMAREERAFIFSSISLSPLRFSGDAPEAAYAARGKGVFRRVIFAFSIRI